jgi:ribosomal-protein-alanine N-acetyltransferase
VAEKLALREEGVSQGYLQIRGTWEDHVRYAMTVEEWAVRGEELSQQFLGEAAIR